jgi:membrane-associated phospholipid phosphatase
MLTISSIEDLPIRDPDARYVGSPLALIGLVALIFLVLDVVPRTWRQLRASGGSARGAMASIFRERWWGRRGAIVLVCLLSFYVTYLSYRNLKSYIPFVTDANHDLALLELERDFFFGTDPAQILHSLLGTGVSAEILSFAYLAFLTFVPVSLGFALIWSNRLATGVWYVTSLSITWLLGALSYYLIPALGPYFIRPGLFADLPETGVWNLQQKLIEHRSEVLADPAATNAVQSIAAFASLHMAVVFVAALIAHLVGAPRAVRIGMWTFLGLTAIATIYFGWHYLVDDVAGLAIGFFAVWVGARLTGVGWRPLDRLRERTQTSRRATA